MVPEKFHCLPFSPSIDKPKNSICFFFFSKYNYDSREQQLAALPQNNLIKIQKYTGTTTYILEGGSQWKFVETDH